MFSPYDVTTQNYQDLDWDSYDFSHENLNDCSFYNSTITDCDFCFSILQNADLRFKKVDKCQFMLANMEQCNLNNVDLSTVRLDYATLTGAKLQGAKLPEKYRKETLAKVQVDNTTIIPLSYFYALTDDEKNNIYRQMYPFQPVSTEHSSIDYFALLHQIIYRTQDYWKSIAPDSKDAPSSIEQIKKVMGSPLGDIASLNKLWEKIRTITQTYSQTPLLFSEEPALMTKKLHHAILNNSLHSFQAEFENELKEAVQDNGQCSVHYNNQ
ncbi:pentapeptide repeat-containing protein [uncultured Legionella sp.]|uniref:pentapeptide repeat-containing protein n=1 Tax=uncultured Legionella sp. TaxID=210934 RepID=UPI0026213861|nr:pentapeptide repeat-containing protein [uncultured Legionella sp.]